MKKKRGAQPENKNAFKHGIYSATFKAAEARLLDKMSITDLSSEIDLLRILNARYLESVNASSQPPDPEAQLSALRAVSHSTHAIIGLLRLQALASIKDQESDELRDQLFTPIDDKSKIA